MTEPVAERVVVMLKVDFAADFCVAVVKLIVDGLDPGVGDADGNLVEIVRTFVVGATDEACTEAGLQHDSPIVIL